MKSLVLSPMSANQDLISDLIAVSVSDRNLTVNNLAWNYLDKTREVIWERHYKRKVTLSERFDIVSSSHLLSAYKNLLFCTLVRGLF